MPLDNDAPVIAREGQTFRGLGALLRHVNLVRLPHTVFALPFALVGVVLASYVAPITLRAVFWVVVAFTTARFAAMGFNRIVDREIDALNPRTRSREIPSGAMTVTRSWSGCSPNDPVDRGPRPAIRGSIGKP